ncbi:MAG: sulfite exporter TauE/SafE family protein [Chloroflexi bacterium]|nr:sulfite exporter TauE/SafE family protein [Chloroflexota bacterium]
MEPENLTLLVAFGAGLLSFLSPCVLPVVPLYFAQLLGASVQTTATASGGVATLTQVRQNTLVHTVLFVLGFSLVFIALGVSVGLVGFVFRSYMPLFSKIAGVLLIILGLHVAGILEIPFLLQERRLIHPAAGKAGYLRSFVVGAAFSVGWVPCVGPILGGILGLAAASATVAQGAALLVAYSLGLAAPFLVMGVTLEKTTAWLKRLYPYFRAISLVSGLLLVAMGVLIFTNRLVTINAYFDFFGLGAGI